MTEVAFPATHTGGEFESWFTENKEMWSILYLTIYTIKNIKSATEFHLAVDSFTIFKNCEEEWFLKIT